MLLHNFLGTKNFTYTSIEKLEMRANAWQWNRYYTWQKRQQLGDGENPNTNTLAKELEKYFDTKLVTEDQFTEENDNLAKRIKIDPQLKLRYKSNQVQYEFNKSTVA